MATITKLRTAIIGTGGIARQHAEAVLRFPDRLELAGAVDPEPDRLAAFAERYAVPRTFGSVPDLLKDLRPDLVQVCTPPNTHLGIIEDCLRAGARVLCEKPLCASLAEFDRITRAENETGRYVSTVYQWRFGAGSRHLKGLIESGELGRPLVALAQTLWYRGVEYYRGTWHGNWSTELGGTVYQHGLHLIDLLLWLMNVEWQSVHAMTATLDRPIEVEDAASATVRFENGALAGVMSSTLSPRQESYLRMDFQRATAEVKALYYAGPEHWRFSTAENSPYADRLEAWSRIPDSAVGDHAAQLGQLLESIARGERPAASGADARRPLEFVASLYKSALTGKTVERGSITSDDPFYHSMNGRP